MRLVKLLKNLSSIFAVLCLLMVLQGCYLYPEAEKEPEKPEKKIEQSDEDDEPAIHKLPPVKRTKQKLKRIYNERNKQIEEQLNQINN
ncbi:MAG: hypothetical protein U9Q21_02040 [Candidatus Auribacterota bacterium]|nr:hypothetical protein [Candidatus Auribacterota bacterium]